MKKTVGGYRKLKIFGDKMILFKKIENVSTWDLNLPDRI